VSGKLIVLALATWRLTSLLVWEDGPFEIFSRLRYRLGVRYNDQSVACGTNWFAKGVVCPACASVWFGALWALAYFLWPDVWWLALPLALSTVSIVIERWVSG
jgi:hypothetical protein